MKKPRPRSTPHRVNITAYLRSMAEMRPYAKAVILPAGIDRKGRRLYRHITFKEIERMGNSLSRGFIAKGIGRGTRTILMVKPGVEFLCIMLALFRIGAVPVLVDPGMGLGRMLHCLGETAAEAFIGIPPAHIIRLLAPRFFQSVSVAITVGRRLFWGGCTLDDLMRDGNGAFPIADTKEKDLAMIGFTTGSTGPAKGVEYTHGMIDAQVRSLRDLFRVAPGSIGLHTYPAFALFDGCLGATTILPRMDAARPAKVEPKNIIDPIEDHGVEYLFGSPALVGKVARYARSRGIRLPSLKTVICGGAPVSPQIIEDVSAILCDDGDIYTTYGATEALPISSIAGREILNETASQTRLGGGVCVGRPVPGTDLRIIRITDEPIPQWSASIRAPRGEIGEIALAGPQVSERYYNRPEADQYGKIRLPDGRILHRTGDVGLIDEKGRIWMCGRMKQRVATPRGTLFTVPCEAVFNNHPAVFRSALVGVPSGGETIPVICVELKRGTPRAQRRVIADQLLRMARQNPMTKDITAVLFHPSFPVDIRHNAKIFREKLALWAKRRIKRGRAHQLSR